MKKLIISIVLANLLVACASEKPKDAITAVPESVATPAPVEQKAEPAPVVAVDPLSDAANILSKRSFFYPLDEDTVQNADKPAVQAHGKYLGEHPERKVRVEGNADERGSNEYNLALGQRRADGVKKMLVLSGAKASQVEAISYGEEKPRSTSHDESAWSQNRRSDIKY